MNCQIGSRRRKGVNALLLAAAFFVSFAGTLQALAQTAPDAVLKEIIEKIKAAQNASPVVDYVDWKEAFEKAPAEQKQAMNISGPDQMKDFYREVLTRPSELLKKQFEQRLAAVPPDQQQLMKASVDRMEQMMRQKEEEMKKRINETTYEVGEAKVDGDKAVVPLTQTYQGSSKQEQVEFVKSDGRWLLPSVGLMSPEQRAAAPGGPAAVPPLPPQ